MKHLLNELFTADRHEFIKRLKLQVPAMVEGKLYAHHQSKYKGFGVEFKEYRNYAEGDNLRQLDWKYFARTDHYMIKEAELEKQHEFLFIPDLSSSMMFTHNQGFNKLQLSQLLIACISYMANNQQDAYSLLSPEKQRSDWDSFLLQLEKLEIRQDYSLAKSLQTFQNRVRKSVKPSCFYFSDGYYSIDQLTAFLKQLASASRQTVFFHIVFESEESLNFSKSTEYKLVDLETDQEYKISSKSALNAYTERLKKWEEDIRHFCKNHGIIYQKVSEVKGIEMKLSNMILQLRSLI